MTKWRLDAQPSSHLGVQGAFFYADLQKSGKNLLTRPSWFAYGRFMSHRNSANVLIQKGQVILVSELLRARRVALFVLVLVLLITNGGAG